MSQKVELTINVKETDYAQQTVEDKKVQTGVLLKEYIQSQLPRSEERGIILNLEADSPICCPPLPVPAIARNVSNAACFGVYMGLLIGILEYFPIPQELNLNKTYRN
ncbi:unnamed protein product [Bubo scandiacus]